MYVSVRTLAKLMQGLCLSLQTWEIQRKVTQLMKSEDQGTVHVQDQDNIFPYIVCLSVSTSKDDREYRNRLFP